MLKNVLLEVIKQIGNKIMRFFIVSILLWLTSYALPELIDSPLLSDRLIESVYHGGRKVNKVSYEDLQKNLTISSDNLYLPSSQDGLNIVESYYTNYLKQELEENCLRSENEDNPFCVSNSLSNQKKNLDSNNNYNFSASSQSHQNFFNKDDQNKVSSDFKQPKKAFSNSALKEHDERQQFSKNLYTLYGNRTIFNMDLSDLEKVVQSAILTDGQAVIFWETLLQMKTDRAKIFYGKINSELDNEYYLFNILPLKTSSLVIITLLIFIITHKIQLMQIKNFFIYNLVSTILTLYILENLFIWKYYIASSIMFVQFAFCIKYLLDSFANIFGFNKEDYDIFTNVNTTKTVPQFILKFIISFLLTLIIGFYALTKIQYFFNYILFYVCVIQLDFLICSFLQYEAHRIFQPLKHFSLILCGVVNFLFTNFHRKISKFSYINNGASTFIGAKNLSKSGDYVGNDSFYIVSETFSFICISYLYEYLFTQANGIGHFFYEKNSENEEFSQKVSAHAKNYKEHQKNFILTEDCLWIIAFFIGVFTSCTGLIKGKYLVFLFSLQYLKITLKVFGSLFKIKLLRCVFSTVLFLLILLNHLTGNKSDYYLFECLNISNSTTISFIKFVVRLAGLVFIILMIIANFEYIVITNDKKDYDDEFLSEQILRKVEINTSTTYEKKKKKKVKTIEIQIVKEDRTPFKFLNIIYVNYDLTMNYFSICLIYYLLKEVEKNYFIIMFYAILLAILIIRIFFIVNEFKNRVEFLYSYMFAFLIGIRLITITIINNSLYFVGCIYLFILVLYYCMIDKRHFFVTLILLFHLYSACCLLGSNYLMILMISLVCLPISIACDDPKYGCSVFRFLIPGLVILFLQLYGFKNLFSNMLVFNSHLQVFFKGFDLFEFVQYFIQGNFVNEFKIIEWIFHFAVYVAEGKVTYGWNLRDPLAGMSSLMNFGMNMI
jgi:hypothetical protein